MNPLRILVLLSLGSLSGAFNPLHHGRGLAQSSRIAELPTKRKIEKSALAEESSFLPFSQTQWASALSMSSNSKSLGAEEESSPSFTWKFDPFFAILLASFLGYAMLAPGEFGSPSDQALLDAFVANPLAPEGFDPLFFAIFNLLGLVPLIASSLALPQGSPRGLPAGPFLGASGIVGFPGAALYFIFRAPTRDQVSLEDLSWFTRNVVENKVFNWAVVALVLYSIASAGLFTALQQDGLGQVLSNYVDFASDSKFVSISTADAIIYNIGLANLIAKDCKLRYPSMDGAAPYLVGAKALLLPFVGPALYCAIREKLPSSSEN